LVVVSKPNYASNNLVSGDYSSNLYEPTDCQMYEDWVRTSILHHNLARHLLKQSLLVYLLITCNLPLDSTTMRSLVLTKGKKCVSN